LGNGTRVLEFGYGYDRANNKLWAEKQHNVNNSELYAYRGDYQLNNFGRGNLNAAHTQVVTPTTTSNALQSQTWNPDGPGNWSSTLHQSQGTAPATETRTPTTGDALVTGFTGGGGFPIFNAVQPNYGGGIFDAFVARLSADGSALVYSTYLGGSGSDEGHSVAVDPGTGDALVTGETSSTNFPTANPLQPNNAGGNDAFVARIS
jgi:hypothetical protein